MPEVCYLASNPAHQQQAEAFGAPQPVILAGRGDPATGCEPPSSLPSLALDSGVHDGMTPFGTGGHARQVPADNRGYWRVESWAVESGQHEFAMGTASRLIRYTHIN